MKHASVCLAQARRHARVHMKDSTTSEDEEGDGCPHVAGKMTSAALLVYAHTPLETSVLPLASAACLVSAGNHRAEDLAGDRSPWHEGEEEEEPTPLIKTKLVRVILEMEAKSIDKERKRQTYTAMKKRRKRGLKCNAMQCDAMWS